MAEVVNKMGMHEGWLNPGFRLGAGPRQLLLAVVLLGGAMLVSPVRAHHSVSMFDSSREVVLEGTVTKLEWTNPHVWIRLNVADEHGELVEWGVEASNPLDLGRKGWSKTSFKPGDEVKITIHPARNDKSFGAFVRATLPDGTMLGEKEEEQGTDGEE